MSIYETLEIIPEHIAHINQIQTITRKILNYMPFTLGEFTDHGVVHVEHLEDIFLDYYLKNKHVELSEPEKYLIFLAIWTHDIGNIIGRDDHEKESIKMMENNPYFKFFKETIGSDIYSCLFNVIVSHRGSYEISDMIDKKIHPKIRTKLICSIFRLIDNYDLTYNRNSYVFYSILKDIYPLKSDHEIHWIAHENIDSIVFNDTKIELGYNDFTKARPLIDDLNKNVTKINKVMKEYNLPFYEVIPFKSVV